METRKIAIACFIGAMICSATAFAVEPAYWWLGLIAGAAAGYVAYEFREVLKAIPVAFAVAQRESGLAAQEIGSGIKNWFLKPHPFLYGGLVLAAPYWHWWISMALKSHGESLSVMSEAVTIFSIIGLGMGSFIGIFLIPFASLGAYSERSYWKSFGNEPAYEYEKSKEFTEQPLTYSNAYRWVGKGLLISARVVMWDMWRLLFRHVLLPASHFSASFVWNLFKLIHSNKRVLCALDSALGGGISYLLAPFHPTHGTLLLFVLFGGFLGAALGVLNFEIVSKRLLHLEAIKVSKD